MDNFRSWKDSFEMREMQQFEPRISAEPPSTADSQSSSPPHVVAVIPWPTWVAVTEANVALARDNARLSAGADQAAKDLGRLSLQLCDMRLRRDRMRWAAAFLGAVALAMVLLEVCR